MVVFGEGRPARCEGPFDAAADGPAAATVGSAEGAKRLERAGRGGEVTCMVQISVVGPGTAALEVEQHARIPTGPPDATGDAREEIGLRVHRRPLTDAREGVEAVDVGPRN